MPKYTAVSKDENKRASLFRVVSIVLLVIQTAGGIFALRRSRVQLGSDGLKYINSVAVFLAEVFKFIASFFLLFISSGFSVRECSRQVREYVIDEPLVFVKVGIPSVLYAVQNNLIFIALSYLSAVVYQVTYQTKILTTAVFSYLLLGRRLPFAKWLTLLLLAAGVATMQLGNSTDSTEIGEFNAGSLYGLAAVLLASLLSGFAGVYTEKLLKGSEASIWLRNMQLAVYGILFNLVGIIIYDREKIVTNGFFQGFTSWAWIAILFLSAGGLIVAAVLKYSNNVAKCFGNAVSIVLCFLLSYYVQKDVNASFITISGAVIVLISTVLYNLNFTGTGFPLIQPSKPSYSKIETRLPSAGSMTSSPNVSIGKRGSLSRRSDDLEKEFRD